jgi:hypothetical protein
VIEQIMLFSLGFLVAALGALAVAPAFWSRAIRLATRRLEMVLPLSPREIRAGRDLLRAELAVEQRRLEQKVESLGAVHARDMAELGRRAVAVAEKDRELEALAACLAARDADVAEKDHELEVLAGRLAARDAEVADLERISAEAMDAVDATTSALHEANARWDRREGELHDLRQELETLQKLHADQSEMLVELERQRVHANEPHAADIHTADHAGDARADRRLEHDAALARLKATTAEIATAEARTPLAADPSLRRQLDRLVADLLSYQDAVDAGSASHESGRASDRALTDAKASLRKRISEVGARVVRLADAGTTDVPHRHASEKLPPMAAGKREV